MKITFYGTAAAEGMPGLFCSCEHCERAREQSKEDKRNIRTRSQTLINDDLLIDFPADTYMHSIFYGLDLRKIKAILITHSHDDHLYTMDFQYRTPCYGYYPNDDNDKELLNVYATKKSGKDLSKLLLKQYIKDRKSVKFNEVKKFKTYDINGYKVTPLRAAHDPKTDPVIYIIQKDGKSILYANDTGYFYDETWEYIEKSGIVFDFVSLDCTLGLEDNYKYHMGIKYCAKVKERLLKKNASENTIFCLNHFSHNGGLTYSEYVPKAKEIGFIVSYDGMEIEI